MSWEWLQEVTKPAAVGGAFGAFLSLFFANRSLGWTGRAFTFVGGLAAAHFLTPSIVLYFDLHIRHEGGVGFMLGMFGMLMASSIARAISSLDLADVVKGWISKGKD